MKHFIAIAGNIGAGKTSLVTLLAERLGWQPFLEPVGENPYLADFYQDMPRWGFHSQVFFLSRRLRHYRGLLDHPTSVVQDRSVYEDAEIFARNLHRQGYISERDWSSYYGLYQAVAGLLPPPDLMVYLRASVPTLMQRIALRSRQIESSIGADYLIQLNDLYEAWIANFKLCPLLAIETDDLDFAHDSAHFEHIARHIMACL